MANQVEEFIARAKQLRTSDPVAYKALVRSAVDDAISAASEAAAEEAEIVESLRLVSEQLEDDTFHRLYNFTKMALDGTAGMRAQFLNLLKSL